MEKMYLCPICGKYHTLDMIISCAQDEKKNKVEEKKSSMANELGALAASIKGDFVKLEEKIEKYNMLSRRYNEDFVSSDEAKYGIYAVSLMSTNQKETAANTVTVKNLPYIQEKKSEVAKAIDEIFYF